jgi:hypothetical protein
MTEKMQSLPFVTIAGSPYERGRQHGKALGDLIALYPTILEQVLADEAGLARLAARLGRTATCRPQGPRHVLPARL